MGLFCSVLHVRDRTQSQVLDALNRVLESRGYAGHAVESVAAIGPAALRDSWPERDSDLHYLIAPHSGSWTTVIESHFAASGAPTLAEVGCDLSSELLTYCLTLVVHDDDLFLYNLDRSGLALDGYNSCPQYFEVERLAESEVEQQRHSLDSFAAILPPGVDIGQVQDLLSKGWWQAHDAGELDDDGVPIDPDAGFILEGERMTAFGTLLGLAGPSTQYPYTSWVDAEGIPWGAFLSAKYRVAGGTPA